MVPSQIPGRRSVSLHPPRGASQLLHLQSQQGSGSSDGRRVGEGVGVGGGTPGPLEDSWPMTHALLTFSTRCKSFLLEAGENQAFCGSAPGRPVLQDPYAAILKR